METPLWSTMQENMYTMPTWSYEGWPRGWQNLVWLRATSGYRSLNSQVSLFMYAKLTFLSFGTTLGRAILEFFVPCKRSFSPIGWNLSWSTHHRQISAPSVQGWEVPPNCIFCNYYIGLIIKVCGSFVAYRQFKLGGIPSRTAWISRET